jgi:hypothetical protein
VIEPSAFGGMRVIESVWLTEKGEPYTVKRSWRERLFSRPWKPLVSTRTIVPDVPYRGAVQLDANTLVMHPQTLREYCSQLVGRAAKESA